MSPLLDRQVKLRQLGRIRLGDKVPTSSGKERPNKLTKFRLTSPSKTLLERAAELWGGTVREWKGSPHGKQYELYTDTSELPIGLPSQVDPLHQVYEVWDPKKGGRTRICDGEYEQLSDEPCLCRAKYGPNMTDEQRDCDAKSRLNVMLPLGDVGHWRLDSKGIFAADELPGATALLEAARAAGVMLKGTLRIEERQSRGGQKVKNYVVPVLALEDFNPMDPSTMLESGESADAPVLETGEQNALPAGDVIEGEATVAPEPEPESEPEPETVELISAAQRRRLFAIGNDADVDQDETRDVVRFALDVGISSLPASRYDDAERMVRAYIERLPDSREKLEAWRKGPEGVNSVTRAQESMPLEADGSGGAYGEDAPS